MARLRQKDVDKLAKDMTKHCLGEGKFSGDYGFVSDVPRTIKVKKNSPDTTASAPPTLDLARFTDPGKTVKLGWFYSLPLEQRRYLLEVAKLFRSGAATWPAAAVYVQLRSELSLNVGQTQFLSFLKGRDPYQNLPSEVRHAQPDQVEAQGRAQSSRRRG